MRPGRGRTQPRNKTRLLLEALEDRLAPAINVAVVGTGGLGDDSGFAAIRDQLNDHTYFDFHADAETAYADDRFRERFLAFRADAP